MAFIIDTETTGLDSFKNQAISIGILVIDDKNLRVVDLIELFVGPIPEKDRSVIDPRAFEANGYGDIWESFPPAHNALDILKSFTRMHRQHLTSVIGQNIRFDRAMLYGTFGGVIKSLLDTNRKYVDTLHITEKCEVGTIPTRSLQPTIDRLGIRQNADFTWSSLLSLVRSNHPDYQSLRSGRGHTATYDCICCLELIKYHASHSTDLAPLDFLKSFEFDIKPKQKNS